MTDRKIQLLLKESALCRKDKRVGDEEACLQQILSVNQDHTESLLRLADIRSSQNKKLSALTLYRAALRRDPKSKEISRKWAFTLSELGMNKQASQAWLRVIDVNPNDPYALVHYSNRWFKEGDYYRAFPFIERAYQLSPDDPVFVMAMAKAYHNTRQLDKAEPLYQKVLKMKKDNPKYIWEYAMQLMLTGKFEEGWKAYEYRTQAFHPSNSGLRMYPFPFPKWQGEPLDGKTLLIHGEQGLGDEIMFASMIPEQVQAAGRVVVACAPSLVTIFSRSFPEVEVLSHSRGEFDVKDWARGQVPACLEKLPEIDFQCPMGSLGRWLRESESSFEKGRAPYLVPDSEKINGFRQQVEQKQSNPKAHRVGLMWTGNLSTGLMGKEKSIPLHQLRSLARDDVQFISLQNTEFGGDFNQVPELNILDFSNQLVDFDATAALVNVCDLVISVDTSVCHLSAALGKTTWVPLRHSADWRYTITSHESCVWYESMRLFRQINDGDWEPVIETLKTALATFLDERC